MIQNGERTIFFRGHSSNSTKELFPGSPALELDQSPWEKEWGPSPQPGLGLIIPFSISLDEWWASSQKEGKIWHKLKNTCSL
uniref:Uncharacterized protein n=1 Tax=Rhinolophus ferrumequinum TaxID=59479 RepID=A0A671EF68_RHIFE